MPLLLSSCANHETPLPVADNQPTAPLLQAGPMDENTMGKWSRSCALCHITGEAGAPVVGDIEEWQRRLQQGEQALMNNVLNGLNSMPPLGYCMACEISDFRAMINYMAGRSQ